MHYQIFNCQCLIYFKNIINTVMIGRKKKRKKKGKKKKKSEEDIDK